MRRRFVEAIGSRAPRPAASRACRRSASGQRSAGRYRPRIVRSVSTSVAGDRLGERRRSTPGDGCSRRRTAAKSSPCGPTTTMEPRTIASSTSSPASERTTSGKYRSKARRRSDTSRDDPGSEPGGDAEPVPVGLEPPFHAVRDAVDDLAGFRRSGIATTSRATSTTVSPCARAACPDPASSAASPTSGTWRRCALRRWSELWVVRPHPPSGGPTPGRSAEHGSWRYARGRLAATVAEGEIDVDAGRRSTATVASAATVGATVGLASAPSRLEAARRATPPARTAPPRRRAAAPRRPCTRCPRRRPAYTFEPTGRRP